MIKSLRLVNYRGFEDHTLELRSLTIAVGHNNAGKSTVVEALRLVSIVTERLAGLNLKEPPSWLDLPKVRRGATPSVARLGIQFDSISYKYSDQPAEIIATFSRGEVVHLYVSVEGEAYAVLMDKDGNDLRTRSSAQKADFPLLNVLPQITPLEHEETILNDDYVRQNVSSTLSSRHFRNQLRIFFDKYIQFRQMATETWPSIQVRQLQGARGLPGDELSLLIRDRDFVAEVSRMGHGLQMWLQTIWFLSRVGANASVVLDEPDVYMHPDLQRRLIRYVRGKFPQIIIATHSIEIIADVAPDEILVVDRREPQSRFANTLSAVQRLIESIGGVHNIHLARLWDSRRCILVEGDDLKLLKLFHDRLFPGADTALDDIPNATIGGWGGWSYAIGSTMFVRNALGEKVVVYCLLDSDYYTEGQIADRYADAQAKSVQLHIWRRKEIENYILVPTAIARVIKKRGKSIDETALTAAVDKELMSIVSKLKDSVFDNIATQYQQANPKWATNRANKEARKTVNNAYKQRDTSLAVVPGKDVFQRLSRWADEEYGRGISPAQVIREMRKSEIDPEVEAVLSSIERTKSFPPQTKIES